MTDMMTYDPDADAVYVYVGQETFDHMKEAGPFIEDVDAEGRILGIEVRFASQTLAPDGWQNSGLPIPRQSGTAK